MEFVKKFTPLDFQAKNFTPPISPNFNSFSKKKTQKISENGEIYTAGENFTLPPALTGWTNSTSENNSDPIPPRKKSLLFFNASLKLKKLGQKQTVTYFAPE